MPEQHSRVEMRRRARKRGPSPVLITVVSIAALVLVGGAGFLGWRLLTKPKTAEQPVVAVVTPSKPAASVPVTPTTSPKPAKPKPAPASTASGTPTPEQLAAADAAARKAIAKAALPFPGAPSVPVMKSVNTLHPKHKYIALTLDDGYNFQPEMLALLKQYGAHCTTFLIGSWAASNKPAVKKMSDAGFEIANHSWSHPMLTKKSTSQIESELTRTQKVLSSVTGNQAPYLRPPFGATDPQVKATAASLGYRIVMWDRTFGDSGRGATPKKLYQNVVESNGGIQPGDVILCHWGSKPSYEALKKILPELTAQGYQFVTISQLIADSK